MLANSTIPIRAVTRPLVRPFVRRAALKDLDRLVPFAAALDHGRRLAPVTAAEVHLLLERMLLQWGSRLIVAERAGQVAGFCAYETKTARLQALYVHENHRGHNLGRELLAFAEQDLARAGAEVVRAEVAPENTAAQAFFARLGYQPSGPQEWVKAL